MGKGQDGVTGAETGEGAALVEAKEPTGGRKTREPDRHDSF